LKPVPSSIKADLAERFGVHLTKLFYFSGGEESSDGVVYRFLQEDKIFLLKILCFAGSEADIQQLCFESRLRFLSYLKAQGVPVVSAVSSLRGIFMKAWKAQVRLWWLM
jgi:Ser/Thr protein kinase RdoA (MazF antagonist)